MGPKGIFTCRVLLLAVAAPHAWASTTFWSISGDPGNFFVPDQFSSINSSTSSVTNVATLGDGSLGFNGGLVIGPGGGLYGIANDSFGASSLYGIQSNGAFSLIGTAGGLGFGFLDGLAWDSGNSTFYAGVEDSLGNTSLYSISTGAVATALGKNLGTGYSGLAYDSFNGLFYGIGNDSSGFSTLYNFSLGGPVSSVGSLGFGFGALTYDAAANVFWAISPVNNAGSQLFQITPGGVASSAFMTLGDGFVELAVATPEPASSAEVSAGLLALTGLLKILRRKS
jgi:hypothetical protein